jgi:methionine synthase II (cobalamin-independent)
MNMATQNRKRRWSSPPVSTALEHLPPERLIPAANCGMKYIPRDLAFAKLKAAGSHSRSIPIPSTWPRSSAS